MKSFSMGTFVINKSVPTKRAQMKWEVKGKEKNDLHFGGRRA